MIASAGRALWACVAAVLAAAAPSRAGTYYVDADAPSGGDGSMSSPLNKLSLLVPLLDGDDTVYLKGVFRGQQAIFTGVSNITITRWPGETTNPLIRGDLEIAPSAWHYWTEGDVYFAAIGERAVKFAWNWGTNIDAQGRHYGFHRRFGSAEGTPPGHFFDNGAGVVYMTPPTNAASPDPRSGLDSYSFIRKGNALVFRRSTAAQPISGIVVRHVDFAMWGYWDETDSGYAVRIDGGTDCLIEDCNFRDTGKHAAGFIGQGSERNTFRRLTSWGLDSGSQPSAGHLVFFSFREDVFDCVGEDLDLRCYTSLDTEGAWMGGAANGVFSHSVDPAIVRSVTWKRVRCEEGNENYESAFGLGPAAALPFDRESTNPDDYPVRFIDCTLINGSRMFFADGLGIQAAAFDRCRLEFPRAPQAGVSYAIRVQGSDPRLLMRSCIVIANGESLFTEPRLFDVPQTSTLLLVGSIIHLTGGVGANCAHIRQNVISNVPEYPNSLVVATQTVFSRDSSGVFLRGNNGMTPAFLPNSLKVRDCWYWNIHPAQFSIGNPNIALMSGFQSIIDPQGVYALDPGYKAPSLGDFEGAKGSPLRTMTRAVANPIARFGINARPLSGHFGAYQYGDAADLTGDGQINSADLAYLLGAWGPCPAGVDPCDSDINGDGLVNAVDLALMLGTWGPTTSQ